MARRPVDAERILDAAFAAINHVGVRNLTMLDIAREAGISRHTLHRRFGTKDDVIAALGDHLVRRFYDALTRAVEADPDPRRRVRVLAECIVRQSRELRLGRLIELEPAFYRRSVGLYFGEWVRAMTTSLAWPEDPPGGRLGERYVRVAETWLRHGISHHIVWPEDWQREIEILVSMAEVFLERGGSAAGHSAAVLGAPA